MEQIEAELGDWEAGTLQLDRDSGIRVPPEHIHMALRQTISPHIHRCQRSVR